MPHTYFVDASHDGVRLDAFLTRHLPTLSRSRIKRLIAAGHVRVDGRSSKPAVLVHRGQRVEVSLPTPAPAELVPEPRPLDVLYEDNELLVINKPPGLAVHPGAGRATGTLANAILARVPQLAGVGDRLRPGIVHRLDQNTSGLLVVAKTPQALASLQAQMAARRVKRRYLALIRGTMPQPEGLIDAPIGRHPRRRVKMAVVPTGRAAITHYRVLERLGAYSLVEAQPVTGRTHQIRVHFAHLGSPVAGDPVYGRADAGLGLVRQALHAWRLEFAHPTTNQPMIFEAALPDDLGQAVARARAGAGAGPTPQRIRRNK